MSVGLHVDLMSGGDGLLFGRGVGEEEGGEMVFMKKVLNRSIDPATGFGALHITSASLYSRTDGVWMGIPNVHSFTNLKICLPNLNIRNFIHFLIQDSGSTFG